MYVFIWLEMIGGGIGGGDGRKGLYSAAAALRKKKERSAGLRLPKL